MPDSDANVGDAQLEQQSDSWYSLGFAPAIEFNWTSRVEVLLGVRIIEIGRNTTATVTPAIALNMVFQRPQGSGGGVRAASEPPVNGAVTPRFLPLERRPRAPIPACGDVVMPVVNDRESGCVLMSASLNGDGAQGSNR